MHRFINQLNVSITTNRACNLRCEHCYIMPHLFKDKTQMTMDDFKKVFDQVERLYELDNNLVEVEWEAIGGETTLMPYEWWEEALPYALDRIASLNKRLKNPGSLNFLTNMMIRDQRYFDLFKEYGHHPCFALYTSWEPDTKRFGSHDKLLGKFLSNLEKLDVASLTLDVIMTQEVMNLGGAWVAKTFVPYKITDFSCKMLSPYGSGKAFFGKAMTDFDKMSQFLEDLKANLPDGVTYTPGEEALSSLYRGTSFQCNGNFYYDLSIEPDGMTHFNANQTGEESASGSLSISLHDEDWAQKVILENTIEASGKIFLTHPQCHQCQYLRYCNAGWWHYKTNQDIISPFETIECPGLKGHWQAREKQLGTSLHDVSASLHKESVKNILKPATPRLAKLMVQESDMESVEDILTLSPDNHAVLSWESLFGKSVLERVVFYDARRIEVSMSDISTSALTLQPDEIIEGLLLSQTCLIHRHATPLGQDGVVKAVLAKPHLNASKLLGQSIQAWKSFLHSASSTQNATITNDLVLDARNEEMLRWVFARLEDIDSLASATGFDQTRILTQKEHLYLARLHAALQKETSLGLSRHPNP